MAFKYGRSSTETYVSDLSPIPAAPAARQPDLDIARGICVLAMIAVHVLLTLGTPEVKATPAGGVIALFGNVAGIFVTLMGVFLAWSPASPAATLRRGVTTWLLGYLLNVLRFVVPLALWDGIPPAYLAALHMPAGASPVGFLLLFGDILQFAGVAMIALAGLRAARFPGWALLVIAAAVAAVSPLMWTLTLDPVRHPVASHLAALITGADASVCFPLFPWLVFPLVGIVVGDALRVPGRLGAGRLAAIGAALFVASWIAVALLAPDHFDDSYRVKPGGMVHYVGYVLMFLAAVRALSARIAPGPVSRFLGHCGSHVTRIYLVQWTLIGWAVAPIGYRALSGLGVALTIAAVTALSVGIVAVWAWLDGLGARRPAPLTAATRSPG
jgi:uncharacterized membrane protein